MGLQLGRLKAVLFDLDDTLVDWKGAEAAAIARLASGPFAAIGVNEAAVAATYAQVMADNQESWRRDRVWWYIQDRLRMLSERLGTSSQLQPTMLATHFTATVGETLALLPGAREALRAARERRWKTALLTNGRVEVQRPKVERFLLQHEVDIVGITEALGAWKPDPQAFERVLERLGVAAHEALMVGDSLEFDVRPARSLGLQTVWMGGHDPAEADLLVRTPGELAERLMAPMPAQR